MCPSGYSIFNSYIEHNGIYYSVREYTVVGLLHADNMAKMCSQCFIVNAKLLW